MEIKYYVRTTGERKLDDSYNQIKYELLVDTEHQPVDSFIKMLSQIGDENAVLLEDDLILCKNFKEEIENVINNHPTEVINFFTQPNYWFETHTRLAPFEYNQCTYYPKGIGKQIAEAMNNIKGTFFQNRLWSIVENAALSNLGITHLQYRPCLIQHNDFNSILKSPGYLARRDTIYFKDYLDECNIDYKDAYTSENRYKLNNCRLKHIQKLKLASTQK